MRKFFLMCKDEGRPPSRRSGSGTSLDAHSHHQGSAQSTTVLLTITAMKRRPVRFKAKRSETEAKFFRIEVFLIVSLLAKPQIFLQNNTLRGENTKQNDMEQNNIAGNFNKIYPG
jgi:hypothetical protein